MMLKISDVVALIQSYTHKLKTEINSKQDAPESAGTAGQVLGLNAGLQPVWLDQAGGGSGISKTDVYKITGNKIIEFLAGKYINTSGSTVDVTDIRDSASGGKVAVLDVSEGDLFYVNCTGGISPRAWCWIDSQGNVLSNSAASISAYKTVLKAPTGASKLILNGKSVDDDSYIGIPIKYVSDNIEEKSVTQEKLQFADFVYTNLIDVYDKDMCVPDYWYYSTTIGQEMIPVYTQSTIGVYSAIKIKCYGLSEVTFGLYPNVSSTKLYWIGATDKNMKLINYAVVNTDMPFVYQVPKGAYYIIASPKLGTDELRAKFVVLPGNKNITSYTAYKKPYYILEDCYEDSNAFIQLPAAYDAVVGDTFEMFFKGIVFAADFDQFDVYVRGSKGFSYKNRYIYTPVTGDQDFTLTVILYDKNHKEIERQTVLIDTHEKPTSPASVKNVLCVGDSLTNHGEWPVEFKRRLVGIGGNPAGDELTNINFIGTKEIDGVNFEGYGGWSFTSYNTRNPEANARVILCSSHDKTESDDQHSIYKDSADELWKLETIGNSKIKILAVDSDGRNFPTSGTLTWVSGGVHQSNIVYTGTESTSGNPFWDESQNKVDFSTYVSRLGETGIDYVFVLLGWNNAATPMNEIEEQARTFINNVHASYPNARVILMGLEVPAREGLTTNYGSSGVYSNYHTVLQYVFNLNKLYQRLAEEISNVQYLNISGQFDTDHNMQTGTRTVNVRNATTETYQTNGVHPALSGYMQIADAAYRYFVKRLAYDV